MSDEPSVPELDTAPLVPVEKKQTITMMDMIDTQNTVTPHYNGSRSNKHLPVMDKRYQFFLFLILALMIICLLVPRIPYCGVQLYNKDNVPDPEFVATELEEVARFVAGFVAGLPSKLLARTKPALAACMAMSPQKLPVLMKALNQIM